MPSPAPFTARVPKLFRKTVTFTGAAGVGATGTVAIATITGAVRLVSGGAFCSTALTSSGGTLEFGTANNTAGLISQTTASDIDAEDFWQDATPEVEITPGITEQLVSADLILTVGTAAVSAGVLEIVFWWLPMTSTGNLA